MNFLVGTTAGVFLGNPGSPRWASMDGVFGSS